MQLLMAGATIYIGGIIMDEVPSWFERLWTIEEVAECLAMSVQTLYGWRCRRYGPPSYRIGNKVRYRPDEVRAWVDQNVAAS